jgi:hypothetical protein
MAPKSPALLGMAPGYLLKYYYRVGETRHFYTQCICLHKEKG